MWQEPSCIEFPGGVQLLVTEWDLSLHLNLSPLFIAIDRDGVYFPKLNIRMIALQSEVEGHS